MDIKEFIEQAEKLTKAAKSLALRAKYETMLRESFIYDIFISDINSKGIDCACYNRWGDYEVISFDWDTLLNYDGIEPDMSVIEQVIAAEYELQMAKNERNKKLLGLK